MSMEILLARSYNWLLKLSSSQLYGQVLTAVDTPSAIPQLNLKAQYSRIREEVDAAVVRVFESQQFILGPEVESLEAKVAAYCDCVAGIGVSSGTDALLLSLMAIGVEPGDEIITTPYSFFSTAGSIWRMGARPVFVDIDRDTFNLSPQAIEAVVTDRTRAILPVHLYGQMADMDPIMEVAGMNDLVVIEDAAQAIGAEYKGRRAGSIGHLGCFSFFPSKNLGGAGDGGMVTTNDAELADRVRLLRNHGQHPKYYNPAVGGNFRLDALQAAVLGVKLKYLPQWTEARRSHADMYRELFGPAQTPAVRLPVESADCRHVYNQFVIRVGGHQEMPGGGNVEIGTAGMRDTGDSSSSSHAAQASSLRNSLVEHLKEAQIGCEIYYPVPLHLQECFLSLGYEKGDLPQAEVAADQTLAIPIYPELTRGQMAGIVSAVAEWAGETERNLLSAQG